MDERSIPTPTGNRSIGTSREPDELPGLYIHIPFCIRKCAYCGFYSVTDRSLIPAFRRPSAGKWISTGGGRPLSTRSTSAGEPPPFCLHGDLEKLIADIRTAFTISTDAEITVEANPADITEGSSRAPPRRGEPPQHRRPVLRRRILLPFSAAATTGLRRSAPSAAARTPEFENIGIDLIYGIPRPGECPGLALATLREAVALDPDHLSCYQLTLEDGTPLSQSDADGERSPSPVNRFRPISSSVRRNFWKRTDIAHYEVSNFARPGRESRHNRKYWNHVPYLGLGPAAHSFSGRERRWNRRSVNAYIGDLESGREPVESREILNDEQLRLEALFLGFRTRRGICLETFKIRYGRDLLAEKRDMLEKALRGRARGDPRRISPADARRDGRRRQPGPDLISVHGRGFA